MRWPSPWSDGFPGWHLECSAMSTRYLGKQFDIHGGGLDLLFPHHECEIAQTVAGQGKEAVRYWMHNNMITLNGQKMGKSLGNAINLEQFFSGEHELLEKAYHPMSIRFFMLQAHYRSPLDFSNKALQGAEKGLTRLFEGMANLEKIKPARNSSADTDSLEETFHDAMLDDFNSPNAISILFEGVKQINSAITGKVTITEADIRKLRSFFSTAVVDILGLAPPVRSGAGNELAGRLIDFLLQMRTDVKTQGNFELSDRIRDELANMGVEVKDTKYGFDWKLKA